MSISFKQTPLKQEHLAAGGRLVEFAGWEMPLTYRSQLEEHAAVRQNAGMFDVSHMLNIDVTGAQAGTFLRRLLANDVARLTVPGQALYSCMLNPEGGVIDDLIVYALATDHFRIVVNAACADKDLAWMQRVAAVEHVEVVIVPRRDLAMIAVQGPMARAKVWQARPAWRPTSEKLPPFTAAFCENDILVARTGYTGEDGFEIMLAATEIGALWRDLQAQDVRPCGLGARDTLRLEAGMNLYGQDMDEFTQPAQAGLSWSVSLKDRNRLFIGRTALEQFNTPCAFLGLKLTEPAGIMRAHMAVRSELGAGEITSGGLSPTLGISIAMARLPLGVKPPDLVQVNLRGKWVAAHCCKLPFVRHGKAVEPA